MLDVRQVAERVERELQRLAAQQLQARLGRRAALDRAVRAEAVERVEHARAVDDADRAGRRRAARRRASSWPRRRPSTSCWPSACLYSAPTCLAISAAPPASARVRRLPLRPVRRQALVAPRAAAACDHDRDDERRGDEHAGERADQEAEAVAELRRRRARACCAGSAPASAAARAAARSGSACRPASSGGRPARAGGSDHGPCGLVQDVDLGLDEPGLVEHVGHIVAVQLACGDQAARRCSSVRVLVERIVLLGDHERLAEQAGDELALARRRSARRRTRCRPCRRAVHELHAELLEALHDLLLGLLALLLVGDPVGEVDRRRAPCRAAPTICAARAVTMPMSPPTPVVVWP